MPLDEKARYTMRIDRDLLEKFGYIAEYEGRTKNRELEQMIKRRVAAFEKEFGEIELAADLGLPCRAVERCCEHCASKADIRRENVFCRSVQYALGCDAVNVIVKPVAGLNIHKQIAARGNGHARLVRADAVPLHDAHRANNGAAGHIKRARVLFRV